ncbi:methyl-accepting chemotaxis protein [Acidihalobacter prosperus]|uniref:Methyl-accepting chemotaxis protein n=1 Tax=Acidihalobacter prosperus TaxID=160660 RepID=A0A1A6C0D4_9GAMM|nr:methyl-accepting chemotaxis protein [Acidihalobacter prosperus]OBS08015.1 hypothetical protein Thpro_022265 [Acidihalobacter prosperus]
MSKTVAPLGERFLRRLPTGLQLALIACLLLFPIGDLLIAEDFAIPPDTAAMSGVLALLALGLYLTTCWIRGRLQTQRQLAQALAAVAEGRFDTRLPTRGIDDRRALLIAFNDMARSVQRLNARTAAALEEVTHAVGELQSSANRVDEGTARQRDAATSTAAAMEEMSTSLGEVAEQTRDAEQRASDASDLAHRGGQTLTETTTGIAALAQSIHGTAQAMNALRERSNEISEVSKLIRSIAEQTNLLALNAAIEAARAGEEGRGFAVVADEVRNLALRSRSSADTITQIIGGIQDDVRHAVGQMDEAQHAADANVSHIGSVVESLNDIHQRVRAALDGVHQIAVNTRQQTEVSTEIARHVEHISGSAWTNSEAAHETAQVAAYLDQLAQGLHDALAGPREPRAA